MTGSTSNQGPSYAALTTRVRDSMGIKNGTCFDLEVPCM